MEVHHPFYAAPQLSMAQKETCIDPSSAGSGEGRGKEAGGGIPGKEEGRIGGLEGREHEATLGSGTYGSGSRGGLSLNRLIGAATTLPEKANLLFPHGSTAAFLILELDIEQAIQPAGSSKS